MIPFNKMSVVGNEEKYLLEALHSGKWCGRGPKTIQLESLVKDLLKVKHCFFVTSCSSALEISCGVAEVGPGDEVILPSFGFVSSANAVVARGATPVFADVNLETWNMEVENVLPLVSSKTKAILTVHYAGSTSGVEGLRKLCKEKNLFLIEDAAQSLGSKKGGSPVGATPWTSCVSLHETKNLSCGEGGLILTDDQEFSERIEIIIEKGTNRQKFFRGQVDKYTWVDLGSSYIGSDLLAAVALAQFEKLNEITEKRLKIYNFVKAELGDLNGRIHWQKLGPGIETNGHLMVFRTDVKLRQKVLEGLKGLGVQAQFHYVPLHNSPFAEAHGLIPKSELKNTQLIWEGLVRLPIFYDMTMDQAGEIAQAVKKVFA